MPRGSPAKGRHISLKTYAPTETEKARRWHESAAARARVLHEGKREREQIKVGDTWLEHGLDASTLAALIERLQRVPGLRRAYLLRKRVTFRPDLPLYVLGISATKRGFTRNLRFPEIIKQLRQSVQFPGETLIINLDTADERLGREFRRLPAARII